MTVAQASQHVFRPAATGHELGEQAQRLARPRRIRTRWWLLLLVAVYVAAVVLL